MLCDILKSDGFIEVVGTFPVILWITRHLMFAWNELNLDFSFMHTDLLICAKTWLIPDTEIEYDPCFIANLSMKELVIKLD